MTTTFRTLLLILTGTLVVACTGSITMRNPATGEVADCGRRGVIAFGTADLERDCVEDYQRQGWQRTD